MNALEVYMDTMHGTAATVAQATQVPRRVIEEVNLDKDSKCTTFIHLGQN
jgi:hypothetical protein